MLHAVVRCTLWYTVVHVVLLCTQGDDRFGQGTTISPVVSNGRIRLVSSKGQYNLALVDNGEQPSCHHCMSITGSACTSRLLLDITTSQ